MQFNKRNILILGISLMLIIVLITSIVWILLKNNFVNEESFIWKQTPDGWTSTQTPPTCGNQPLLSLPVNINLATSILYPGQVRGGNYKPHGGIRFDNARDNFITVKAPIDGYLVRGARYIESNEVQYLLDFMNNCGIMYRFDHLKELPQSLMDIVDKWPKPSENSSQTNNVSPAILFKKGDLIAIQIGLSKNLNVGFDWGVYDFRNTNEASKSTTYQAAHQQDKELSWHAVCWLEWLPNQDSLQVNSLPSGDQASGKKSDYCM